MPLHAQGRVLTFDDIQRQILSGARPENIARLARVDCIDFPVNERTRVRLGAIGASPDLIANLEAVCFKGAEVLVETTPAASLILVGDDTVANGTKVRVVPAAATPVVAIRRGIRRTATVTLPARQRTSVRFEMPADTLQWPAARTRTAIAAALKLDRQYPPIEADPPMPEPPIRANPLGQFSLGATLLGTAAFGASYAVCKESITTTSAGYVGSRFVDAGTTVDLGYRPSCQQAMAAAGSVGGGLLFGVWNHLRFRARQREFAAATARRPEIVRQLTERRQQRELALEQDSAVVAEVEKEKAQLADLRDRNDRILARNATLPPVAVARIPLDSSVVVAEAPADSRAVGGSLAVVAPAAVGDEPLVDEVDVNIPTAPSPNATAVAVVIGNRTYQNRDLPPVDYAANDARTMRRYLVGALGFKEENIIYVENATYSTMRSIFAEGGRLSDYVQRDSGDVVVFYSGHGAPDPSSGKTFLVPIDAEPQKMALTGFSVDLLYENLAKLPAKSLTVYIDACFSGSSDKGTLFKGMSPGLMRVENPVLAAKNAAVFSASASNQVSGWFDEKKHGLFSYFVFKGLQGGADLDQDGKISVENLADYVAQNVARISRRVKGREQTPQLTTNAVDRVIAEVARP